MTTTTDTAALAAALHARAGLFPRLASASEALERAEAADAAAQTDAVKKSDTEPSDWVERGARRWEAWDAGGRHGAEPALTADATALLKAATAQARAQQTALTVARRREELAGVREELTAAEHQVSALKLQARRDRVEALLARLDELWAEELTLFAQLATSDPANSNQVLSSRAVELLQAPGHRPSAAALFPSGHVRTDIYASPLGQIAALDAASAEWARFDAGLEAQAGITPPAAQAAA